MVGNILNGTEYTTIPDYTFTSNGGLLEVKSGQQISFSPQLQAQVWIGQQPGNVPPTLAVGPNSTVYRPVVRATTTRAAWYCDSIPPLERLQRSNNAYWRRCMEEPRSMLSAGCFFRGNYMLPQRAQKVVQNLFCTLPELEPNVWDFTEPAKRRFNVSEVVGALVEPPFPGSSSPFFLEEPAGLRGVYPFHQPIPGPRVP